MNAFQINLILALCWAALNGRFDLVNLAVGFALGALALLFLVPSMGARHLRRLGRAVALLALFIRELVESSFQVAWDVITPAHRSRPDIVAMPLDVRSDAGILLITGLISLTPGSLSLDLSADRRTLYVHVMFADDPEAVVARLKQGFERRVIAVLEEDAP